ncbi:MAG: hypothetical protein ACTTH7_09570 [Treponema sp.]
MIISAKADCETVFGGELCSPASLDLDAMFKIKLLLHKDLILNSLSAVLMRMSLPAAKSNQLLGHPYPRYIPLNLSKAFV